jgi:hypothetical protein
MPLPGSIILLLYYSIVHQKHFCEQRNFAAVTTPRVVVRVAIAKVLVQMPFEREKWVERRVLPVEKVRVV